MIPKSTKYSMILQEKYCPSYGKLYMLFTKIKIFLSFLSKQLISSSYILAH